MQLYVGATTPVEIAGIGLLEQENLNTLRVIAIELPKQEVTGVSADYLEGELQRIIIREIKKGRSPSKIRFRWHSHGEGRAYFSPRDLQDIAETGVTDNYVVNLVMNSHGEYCARIDQFTPFHFDNVPINVVIEYPNVDALRQQIEREVARKVIRKEPSEICKGQFSPTKPTYLIQKSTHGTPTSSVLAASETL